METLNTFYKQTPPHSWIREYKLNPFVPMQRIVKIKILKWEGIMKKNSNKLRVYESADDKNLF